MKASDGRTDKCTHASQKRDIYSRWGNGTDIVSVYRSSNLRRDRECGVAITVFATI